MINNDILSDPELRRFENQIVLPQIGMDGQKKLKKAKVAVIGAGGLGAVVLQYLAASGLGHLGIVDYSLVEETNIQRQTLYGGSDLGKLKTIISRQHLQNLFPFINFEIINLKLTSDNTAGILQPFELIVDATNDEASHEAISDACKNLKLPWIYGAIHNFSGEIAVFDKNSAVGYHALKSEANTSRHHQMNGTASLAYGLIGTFMALEVLKLLVNNSETLLNKVLSVDMLSYQFVVKSLI